MDLAVGKHRADADAWVKSSNRKSKNGIPIEKITNLSGFRNHISKTRLTGCATSPITQSLSFFTPRMTLFRGFNGNERTEMMGGPLRHEKALRNWISDLAEARCHQKLWEGNV